MAKDQVNAISILFAGDFAPCRGFERIVLDNGRGIFGDLQEDILNADLSFLNLETPLCTGNHRVSKIGPNLRSHPQCVKALAEVGFRVVSLANNHIMDFGPSGLKETVTTCQNAGLLTCGAGRNLAEAQKVSYIETKGLKIAFVAVAEHEFSIADLDNPGAAPLDTIDNALQIERAKEEADLVLVSIHGGNEYFPYPRPGLRKVCRFYINRGADAVICHHPHVPGAYELYDGKPIVYSLGNLIFDHSRPPKNWDLGYVCLPRYNVQTKRLISHEIMPYLQSVPLSGIKKMHKIEKAAFLQNLEGYKIVLQNDEAYNREWLAFCQKEKKNMLIKQYAPIVFPGLRRFSRIINPEIFFLPTKTSRRLKLNMVHCESHLEILQTVLAQSKY